MQTPIAWENFPPSFLLWVSEAIVGGLVLSHVALWMAHMKYKLHVAENYVSKVENTKVEKAIDGIQQSLKDILIIVHELKGRAQGSGNQ